MTTFPAEITASDVIELMHEDGHFAAEIWEGLAQDLYAGSLLDDALDILQAMDADKARFISRSFINLGQGGLERHTEAFTGISPVEGFLVQCCDIDRQAAKFTSTKDLASAFSRYLTATEGLQYGTRQISLMLRAQLFHQENITWTKAPVSGYYGIQIKPECRDTQADDKPLAQPAA